MKKYISIMLSFLCILSLVGCGKKEKYEIEILIPAGSTEAFVYSDEEICPTGNKIKIWAGAGLSDTEVILKPVNENVETGYVAEYLTHGMPVELDTNNVKDQWFKIGVSVQNDSDKGPIAVSVEVEGVEVRIAEKTEVTFRATILEIKNQTYLVEPVVGSNELKSSDQIVVPMKNMNPSPEPKVGDVIEITYDGSIAESYPAQITEVYGIKVVEAVPEEVTVGGDLIPMVMVNGELYMDTGHESFKIERTDHFDGEIISTVDGTKQPTKDNESNFGTGYGYQYGSQEGTIEIYMNDKWWIFATEKALASSQLMVDPVAPVTIKNIFTGEEAPLSVNEDIRVISDILLSDTWNTEGTTDCLNNIEIIINGETYKYHSDCGTFNDKVKQQYLSLDDATKEKVNAIIEEHISLITTEVPIE